MSLLKALSTLRVKQNFFPKEQVCPCLPLFLLFILLQEHWLCFCPLNLTLYFLSEDLDTCSFLCSSYGFCMIYFLFKETFPGHLIIPATIFCYQVQFIITIIILNNIKYLFTFEGLVSSVVI